MTMQRMVIAFAAAAGLLAACPWQESPLLDIDRVRLESLRAAAKFDEDPALLYPGAPNGTVRRRCEDRVNHLIDDLMRQSTEGISQRQVFDRFKLTLLAFEGEDSEERDRLGDYLEEIMSAMGIESSGALLNRWRYGMDP